MVVVSIFVNPTQFDAGEDLEKYPRDLARDLALAAGAGADLVFTPTVAEMYPTGFATWVDVEGLTEGLCGALAARAIPRRVHGGRQAVQHLWARTGPISARRTRSNWP